MFTDADVRPPIDPIPQIDTTPRALWAFIAAFILVAVVYSVVVPPFETPDEIWHFAFIQHLASGKELPVSQPDTQEMWRQQGVQAPGYYIASAALTGWIDQSDFAALYARANPHRAIGQPDALINRNYLIHHRDEGWPWRGSILALHIARFFSIFLGAVTIWASFRAVAPILGGAWALIGAAVFAFIPQFVFISAAASNDNAVNALAALVLWRLVVLVLAAKGDELEKNRKRRRDFLVIGVLLGLAALSKLSALGLVGLTGLVVLYCAWRNRSLRPIVEAVLWIGAPVVAIAGWWYLRNVQLYGDPLAWNIWQANILLRVETASWRTIASELTSLERSFWGLFGWLNVAYPDVVYLLLRLITVLIGVGVAMAGVRWLVRSRKVDERWIAGGLLFLWLLLLTISWLRFMRIAPAAQGRYFFPAAPTIAMFVAIGLSAWRTRIAGWAVFGFMFGLSVVTPLWIIAPAYQAPVMVRGADLLQPVNISLGGHFAITGVYTEPDTLQPGETAVVRIAWQALEPPDADYSVFIHLVDADGLTIAQLDTMPGGGLLPTSQWAEGETLLEEYLVTLPNTAYTPNRAEWRIGMYDAASGERLPAAGELSIADAGEITILGDSVRIGQVDIAASPGALPNPVAVQFADNITLAGYALNQRQFQPGNELEVTLYWQARGPIQQDYTTFVHLLDADFAMHGGHDGAPGTATTEWTTGAVYTDTHRFVVPDSALPGAYQLEIGLYTRPDFDRLLLLDAAGAEGADRLLLGPLRAPDR